MELRVPRPIKPTPSFHAKDAISGRTSPSTIGSALPKSSTTSAPTSKTTPSPQVSQPDGKTGPGPVATPSATAVSIRENAKPISGTAISGCAGAEAYEWDSHFWLSATQANRGKSKARSSTKHRPHDL